MIQIFPEMLDEITIPIKRTLECIYPFATSNSNYHERNLSGRLYSVIEKKYPEVCAIFEMPIIGHPSEHIDLVLFTKDWVVFCECKSIVSSTHLKSISTDIKRLRKHAFDSFKAYVRKNSEIRKLGTGDSALPRAKYLVALVSTWRDADTEWVLNPFGSKKGMYKTWTSTLKDSELTKLDWNIRRSFLTYPTRGTYNKFSIWGGIAEFK